MKTTLTLAIATLAVVTGYCTAAEPMASYKELVLKIEEFRKADAASAGFLHGKQGHFEKNLKKNGWKESVLQNNYSMLASELGTIKKYTLFHYIIIDEELRESAISTDAEVLIASEMLNLANLPAIVYSMPESQSSIEARSKLQKISKRLSHSSKYTVAVGLSEGDRQGGLAIIESREDSPVPTISTGIVDAVLEMLKTALEMAGKASANSVTNYSKTISTGKSNVIFKVSSDGASRVYIAAKDLNGPSGHFEITMDDVRSIVALLEAAKSGLENIVQTAKAAARDDAANHIRNKKIFEDDKTTKNAEASSKSTALPEPETGVIQAYFKANPNMDTKVLSQIKELLAGNDYGQSMALCDILLKNSPHDEKLRQFKESIASTERITQIKNLLNAEKYSQALSFCEEFLKATPGDSELQQIKKLIISEMERNRSPVLVEGAPPQYPSRAKNVGSTYFVYVQFVVSASGKVIDSSINAKVVSTGNYTDIFKKISIDTIRQWVFKPCMKNGLPVDKEMEVEINFYSNNKSVEMSPITPMQKEGNALTGNVVLNTDGVYNLSDLDQHPSPRGMRAEPLYPFEMKRQGIAGEVILQFVIDQKGDVRDVIVVSSSRREFESPAVQAIQKWKFRPGKKRGKAVAVRLQIPVAFNLNE